MEQDRKDRDREQDVAWGLVEQEKRLHLRRIWDSFADSVEV
jgi:hypothetical protein